MQNINMNPSDLSAIFQNKILENSCFKSIIYKEVFYHFVLLLICASFAFQN